MAKSTDITKVGSLDFHGFIFELEVSLFVTKNDASTAIASGLLLPAKTEAVSAAKTSFAGLFSTNRKLTTENKLMKFTVEDGTLTLESNNLIDAPTKLGFCLVGYIASKFLGLKAIRALSQSWGASFQQHDSGWLIFRFACDEDKQRILAEGPYFIYGRSLLLKNMPNCFVFKEDDNNLTPVWAILPLFPLECWHLNALGKIGSRLYPHYDGFTNDEDGTCFICPHLG
ncbi:UNVERIFIED_CONTAM: hypothetical protein Sradi_4554100 [Sesamum radiatum]|uniref:DUF4283 domain-containing protein n=1 Tax=Sesamum radiatum TaxID=300843 RepID=A0AAW2NBQ1_SESRA